MFYFIHVQGQNALTTLLHLADEMSSCKFPPANLNQRGSLLTSLNHSCPGLVMFAE